MSRYNNFIKTVCSTEVVYCLKNSKGIGGKYSDQFEKVSGESVLLFYFWSSEAMIRDCQGWDDIENEIIEIPLFLFLKEWCIDMEEKNILAGVECDSSLHCYEVEPLKLGIDILEELVEQSKLDNFIEIYNLYNNHLS